LKPKATGRTIKTVSVVCSSAREPQINPGSISAKTIAATETRCFILIENNPFLFFFPEHKISLLLSYPSKEVKAQITLCHFDSNQFFKQHSGNDLESVREVF
jgi:hypothetical protein